MDKDMFELHWNEIKNQIRRRWSKFTNSDIESCKNNMDKLASKLEKVYGYAKAQAERECHEFRLSLRPGSRLPKAVGTHRV